ncbi:MAG: tetratricopeptide repeat protein [Bacteroidia bacterium]|nr:tetratricopeptide repeat protein [Bacteroidia bacterium]
MIKTFIFVPSMLQILKSFNRTFYILAAVALIAVCVTYSNHFHNDFHFDDSHTIYNNMYIRDIKNIPLFFKDARTTSSFPPNQAYRPGLTTLNAIDYWIMRQFEDSLMPQQGYYHLSIFISYIALGLFVFLFILDVFNKTIKSEWNKYAALFASTWFWLHTSNAETINYIISRSDSFSTCMIMLSFVMYIYIPKWRSKYIYLIPMAAGFFVKEPALMFVPLLFLYIVFFEKNFSITDLFAKNNRKTIIKNSKPIAIGLIVAGILFLFSRAMTPPTWFSGGLSHYRYIITQPFVILHYFKNFFYPNNLSADTDWKELTSIADIRFIVGMLFIVAMLYVAYKTSEKTETRPIAFGILWFFLALLPTSSIIAFSEVLNDHRPFFPYIGLFIAATCAVYVWILKYKQLFETTILYRGLLFTAMAILLCAHAYGTYQRNIVWKSEMSLWEDVAVKSPGNGRGLMNLGLALMGEKKYAEAENYFKKGLELMPQYAYLYINMGMVKSYTNDTAAAEVNFKKAIELGFNTPDPFYFYAQYLCGRKRLDEAIPLLRQAMKLSDGHIFSRYVLLNVYADKYMWDDLDKLVNESIKLFPNDPEIGKYVSIARDRKTITQREQDKVQSAKTPQAYIDLSLAYFNEGKYKECIEACNEVLKLDSTNADAYNNISCCYNQLGEWDLSVVYGEKAIKFRPNFEVAIRNVKNIKERNESVYRTTAQVKANPTPEGFLQVSTMYFNGLRYGDCIKYAEMAIKLRPNYAEAYNNICAAYSKMNNWDEAERACQQAQRINPSLQTAGENLRYIQQQKNRPH